MNLKSFKPMLAATLSEDDLLLLKYPLIIQQKIDGIRCCIVEGKALSRKLKPIPNNFIRNKLESSLSKNVVLFDGELIIEGKTFNEIQSAIMSEEGEPDFKYIVFDFLEKWDNTFGYKDRISIFPFPFLGLPFIEILNSHMVNNLEELLEWEKYILQDKYEGIILRDPNSFYKFGRSTIREQSLMKFKRFSDSEAVILYSNQLQVNTNEPTLDNLGYTEHSSHKANLINSNMLGSWTVKDINVNSKFYGVTFNIGSGFNLEQRKLFWKESQIGKIVTYKFQLHGSKNKPRIPIFLGFRKDI